MVFGSATVELSVPVTTPLAFVVEAGWVSVLPLPVATSTTVFPAIGLSFASRAVTVIVEAPMPAVIVRGDAVTLDRDEETPPAVTVTIAVCVTADPLIVAETVFVPTAVELSAPVAMPLASVGPVGWVSELPLPVTASTTVA